MELAGRVLEAAKEDQAIRLVLVKVEVVLKEVKGRTIQR